MNSDWKSIVEAGRKLLVAGPWEEIRPRCWTRSVIWRPRLDGLCPVIDLDGHATIVTASGSYWAGYKMCSIASSLEEAKAEEDRILREDGWILAEDALNVPLDPNKALRLILERIADEETVPSNDYGDVGHCIQDIERLARYGLGEKEKD